MNVWRYPTVKTVQVAENPTISQVFGAVASPVWVGPGLPGRPRSRKVSSILPGQEARLTVMHYLVGALAVTP